MRDTELEAAVVAGFAHLREAHSLDDKHGRVLDRDRLERRARRYAAGFGGSVARLRPYLRDEHPWAGQVRDVSDRLLAEQRRFEEVARAPSTPATRLD